MWSSNTLHPDSHPNGSYRRVETITICWDYQLDILAHFPGTSWRLQICIYKCTTTKCHATVLLHRNNIILNELCFPEALCTLSPLRIKSTWTAGVMLSEFCFFFPVCSVGHCHVVTKKCENLTPKVLTNFKDSYCEVIPRSVSKMNKIFLTASLSAATAGL